jgi:uncharacterized SAM-binding protein YcdF (DUF218 family)
VTHPAAIIIFGAAVRPDGEPSATLRHRVAAAAHFGATLEAPIFLPTGALGRFPPAECVVMARLLREAGVPAERIRQEPTGVDTLSSAVACLRLLREAGHQGPVYAATSAYHLPRCLLLLWLAGVPARAVPPHPAPAATHWRKRWWWRLREVPALPYDALLMLWERLRSRA